MSTTMRPLRCTGLKTAVLSDDESAVLFELAMANGKIFPLELDAPGIALMLRALLASAAVMPSADGPVDAQTVVQIPAERMQMSPAPDGSQWWTLRLGGIDLAFGPMQGSGPMDPSPQTAGGGAPVH